MQRFLLSLLLVLSAGFSGWAQAPATLTQSQDLIAFLGPYPAPGSDEAKADLAIVLWHQRTRSSAEVQRAASEIKLDLGTYAVAMGCPMDAIRYPKTADLLDRVSKDLRASIDGLKKHHLRPRPQMTDARVKPAIEPEFSPSYPSGHATRGLAFALVLAELAPDHRDALLAQGRQIGVDRVIGGVHFPSDIEAGQRLALRLMEAWLGEAPNRALVGTVRTAEWTQALKP